MKRYSLNIILLLAMLMSTQALAIFDHQHSVFNTLLKKHVIVMGSQSSVDYAGFQEDFKLFNQYIGSLEAVPRAEYDSWSKNEKIAFLINTYNAQTIRLIINKYPDLKSIKDLGGFFSSPWQKEFFTLFGKKQDLDHIEHEILRKKYQEARLHFVLVCASRGCPALKNEAYTPAKLESQFQSAMVSFLGDRERNYYDAKEQTVYLSSLFKWYKGDFVKAAGSLENFVASYLTKSPREQNLMRLQKVDIEFLDYDWSLNKVKN